MLNWLWLAVAIVALDQGSKAVASKLLTYQMPMPVLPFFNLTLSHNTGAAFSFLSNASGWQRWFFVVLAVAVSIFIMFWLRGLDRRERWLPAALMLILGGAVGNLLDRLIHGYVVDFIQLHYHAWYWPVFNVADSAITVGVVIMVAQLLFGRRRAGDLSRHL